MPEDVKEVFARYQKDPYTCPWCGLDSLDYPDQPAVCGSEVRQFVHCRSCKRLWEDVYALKHMSIIE